jgi:nucleoside-diphosphate-sugar epimerase
MQLADLVNGVMGGKLAVDVQPTEDMRSYHVSSAKIQRELGFAAQHSIEEAVQGLIEAFKDNRLQDPMNNPMYFNIKRMQQVALR